MKYSNNILFSLFLLLTLFLVGCHPETDSRQNLRLGNKKYNKGLYTEAENYYLKSLEKNKSIEAEYGAGNAIQKQRPIIQSDLIEKMDSMATGFYENGLTNSTDNRSKLSMLYHNLGNLKYSEGLKYKKTQKPDMFNQKFLEAVENYKSSLRLNPDDDETRYNLTMALYMIEKNKNEQSSESQNDKNQDKNEQDQDKKENNNHQEDNQKERDNNQEKNDVNQEKQPQKQNKKDLEQPATIDKKRADQLLNAAQRDENEVQKKVEKAIVGGNQYEKDW